MASCEQRATAISTCTYFYSLDNRRSGPPIIVPYHGPRGEDHQCKADQEFNQHVQLTRLFGIH